MYDTRPTRKGRVLPVLQVAADGDTPPAASTCGARAGAQEGLQIRQPFALSLVKSGTRTAASLQSCTPDIVRASTQRHVRH